MDNSSTAAHVVGQRSEPCGCWQVQFADGVEEAGWCEKHQRESWINIGVAEPPDEDEEESVASSWAAQQAWQWGCDEDGGVRVKMVEAIRATIHEAARRVCNCDSYCEGRWIERAGKTYQCPARKVLEMLEETP